MGQLFQQHRGQPDGDGRADTSKVFADDPNCHADKKALTAAMNSLFAKDKIKIEMFGPPSRQVSRIIRKASK